VVVNRHRGVSVRRERCEFTGGRDDLADGTRVFGGADELVAPEPDWPADEREVQRRLLEFAGRIGDDVVLQHRIVATGRSVVAGGGPVRQRVRAVFALTGTAGRALPIGLSGLGDGLSVLTDHRLAARIAATRTALLTATGPVTGSPPAVLSPQAAAVLVHEAIGHYAEAIHVGAPAVHRLFTRVASECVSVVDSGDRCHDDEGVLSLGPTQVMRRGVLVAQLHNRATARAAASPPTGNARAATVWDPPIPRVVSLICGTGRRSEAALLRAMGSGVYVHRVADGYRQGTRIAARVVLGEHVERGRRTGRYFTGSQVAGRLDMLTTVVELGDRAERGPNAMCGKDGQLLFDVVTVAPAMRLSALDLMS
jgi:predicted Zn-dependent protease